MAEEKLKKRDFYNLDRMLATESIYCILLGERSNGKSFSVKKHAVDEALDAEALTCVLLRRLDEDIKASVIEDYFNDEALIKHIIKRTNGRYNCIVYYRSKFYFAFYDKKTEKTEKGFAFCKAFALSNAERYKSSTVLPNVKTMIYEEFCTTRRYLRDETKLLFNIVSSIFRLNTGRVFLIANKITRVSPYFTDFGLRGVPKMKDGQLDTYVYKTEAGQDVKISVEMCASPQHEKSAMFWGKNDKVINGSEWETNEHPLLKGTLNDYNILYELSLEHMGNCFNILLLSHKTEDFECVYVYPASLKKHERLLTESYSTDRMITPTLLSRVKAECYIVELLNQNKLVYPSNLIGDDFISTIQNMKQSPFSLA